MIRATHMHRTTTARCRRRGVLTLELVLVLPILLIVVLGVVQLSLMLLANQALGAAASVGARAASLPGATSASVEAAVAQALAPWRFAGDIDPVAVTPDPLFAPTGAPMSVTVSIDTTDAAPNLLQYIGLSIEGQKLQATYVARKE
jgi:Flp pilus assembly protein TadG